MQGEGKDSRGWRKVFGVLGPSTNTIVQPDFDDMRPAGVTNHYSRIIVSNAQAISNETFLAGAQEIADNTMDAVKSVMTCDPEYLVMGMSAITFYGGRKGRRSSAARSGRSGGLYLSTGSESLAAAIAAYGGVKKTALVACWKNSDSYLGGDIPPRHPYRRPLRIRQVAIMTGLN
ncbi:hypothetical protein [Niveispirillum sp. BGYR6]|uniref:hypothetical protein n=1 Tax=Niveispirillum sp. BGYR6 TaxID=2971249 RepID=UPI0022B995C9|nr:hypothetical protein [Niveispirillum sp. BGYR6]MDG5497498.1 hypothetical protein [Niveispirillum sp. BGYR6]